MRCHEEDGRGTRSRVTLARIPDFTRREWQGRRNDHALTISIRDGKGQSMPPFADKLSDEQIRELVARIRKLAPQAKSQETKPANDFDSRFRQLEQEFLDLNRQFKELTRSPQEF